jgi:hypothetical protein
MKMKKLLFATIAIAGFTLTSIAQERPASKEQAVAEQPRLMQRSESATPQQKVPSSQETTQVQIDQNDNDKSKTLFNELGLSDEQISTVRELENAIKQKKAIIESNTSFTATEKAEKIKKLTEMRMNRLKEVLGASYERYAATQSPGGETKQ